MVHDAGATLTLPVTLTLTTAKSVIMITKVAEEAANTTAPDVDRDESA